MDIDFNKPYLLLDPIQFKEFGGSYFHSSHFEYRYLSSGNLFYRSHYVPFGPVVETYEDFVTFLKYYESKKCVKIKIDLPLILNEEDEIKIKKVLYEMKYEPSLFLQDEETIIVTRETLTLNSHIRRNVKKCSEVYSISSTDSPTEFELNEMYSIYLESANRIGFIPKSFNTFLSLSKSCVCVLGKNKKSQAIEGFIIGFKKRILDNDGNVRTILQFIFSGLNATGRLFELGYGLNEKIFTDSFDIYDIDIVDFHGASRTKGVSYLSFKKSFGGVFKSYPGSFAKKIWL